MGKFTNGFFMYRSVVDAIKMVRTSCMKWNIMEAYCNYCLDGIEPEDKAIKNNPVYVALKGGAANIKRKREQIKGGGDEKKSKGSGSSNLSSDGGGCEKIIKDHSFANGDTEQVGLENEQPCDIINKNKNENKNENVNLESSSSSKDENIGVREECVEEEEEDERENLKEKSFYIPTKEEVIEFVKKANRCVNVDSVYAYLESNNWILNGRRIENWRAFVLRWNDGSTSKKVENKDSSSIVAGSKDRGFQERRYTKEELDSIMVDLSKVGNNFEI